MTTIHDIFIEFDHLSTRMHELSRTYSTGVIIPMLERDLKNPEISKIVDELNECTYLKKIYIAFAGSERGYDLCTRIFGGLQIPQDIIWCNSAAVDEVFEDLASAGLDLTRYTGKGRDVWIAIGIASLELDAFALHDGDIRSYSRMIPTKLLYPIIEPELGFLFTKGYYARIDAADKVMYGRIYRLFITPILEVLCEKFGYDLEYLRFLQSFRYILSGEVGITTELALNLRVACGWGLELGTLSEFIRNAHPKRACQVDLGIYEHKHRVMTQSTNKGILRVARECFITILRTLTEMYALTISEDALISIAVAYRRMAADKIRQYRAMAVCNNLDYDLNLEGYMMEQFANVIVESGLSYLKDPVARQMPNWLRALSAMPDLRERLQRAGI
ncbi:MAG: glycosyl transferase [Candidatus Syntrophoarchaeum caldarius]|uniref:Glycosyl transferase n=1 Tax=Candidatus Syntropharchaeum caldarium TaxID=1838285 RepID=A0A1F2PAL8_9EURY|nr:MAG: glycosyl transferase [Candidatus Syntrophoarchaeum caldarius]